MTRHYTPKGKNSKHKIQKDEKNNFIKFFQNWLDFFFFLVYNVPAMKEYTVNITNITWDREDDNLPENIENYKFESEEDIGEITGYELCLKDLHNQLEAEFHSYPEDIEDVYCVSEIEYWNLI